MASLAHPGLAGMDAIIPRSRRLGLDALEVRHTEHDAATETVIARWRQRLGSRFRLDPTFTTTPGARRCGLGEMTLTAEEFAALEAQTLMSVIRIDSVQKNYGGLRPLRILDLSVAARGARGARRAGRAGGRDPGEPGHRRHAAGRGDGRDVRRVHRRTLPTATPGSRRWTASASSARARCLLEGSTLQQNLALPFTLEIDPVPAAVADAGGRARGRMRDWPGASAAPGWRVAGAPARARRTLPAAWPSIRRCCWSSIRRRKWLRPSGRRWRATLLPRCTDAGLRP